jgi:hypothetical protein
VIQIHVPANFGPLGAAARVNLPESVRRLDRGAIWIKMKEEQHHRTPYAVGHHGDVDAFVNPLAKNSLGAKHTSVHPNNA